MTRLSIYLTGSFCVTLGGGSALQFKSSKDKALLAYLAVEADRPHARDKLAALFWPEMPDSEARSNLRYTLSSLRRTIGERDARPPTLLVDGDNIQFNRASSAWVDILELKDGLPQTQLFNVERVEKAVLLYRGPFLEGFSLRDCPEFETWLVDQQEQVSRLVVEALGRLANYYEHRHDYARALDFARPQVEMEPWEETAQRRLMRLLAFNGQRTEALAQYESLHKSLCAELNVEPEIETQRLVEQIRAQTLQPELEITSGRPIRGYELGERLGVGYMGAVYRAHQLGVGRDVAIKIIKPEYADQPDFIRRFELEARLVARLEHPNIVPLYDFWREPGGAFLVMRWLRGGNLADSIATKPWPIDAAVQLILQIASALHTAHQIGVIHRDIKPANILLDNSGNGYLSDFGIAALVEPFPEWGTEIIKKPIPVTTTSLGYTSPEVIAGAQPGPSADIYSLGVVLFELLTAQHPFPPESTSERNVEKHSQFLPSIQTVLPELPHSVDEVIGQATAVRSEDRYPDALALAHAFQQAVKSMAFFEINLIEGSDQMRNPYKGLRAFEEADQGEFFGRAALVEHLLERLNSEEPFNRFLAVVGPGGSGKSSLIRAGLIPRLRQGGAPGSNRWYFVTLTPGTQPFTELTLGLLRISVELQQDLDEDLRAGEAGLVRVAARILPPDAELLLVIDQFEELYTPQVDPGERENFLQMLCAAVTTPGSRVRLLIGLRADFYDRPLMHPQLSQFMQCRTDVIVSMTADELVAAIEEPARQVGAELEEGLTALLVADVNKQPGALPLLQYTLTELFERRERRLLTRSAYDEIGGVTGSLAQRTEEIYLSLDPAGRAAARQIFLRLVTFGEGVDETRRRVLRSDLTGIAGLSGVDALLDLFAENRLLTFSHDPLTRQPTVELAHEALLQAWGRLQDWLDESRADVHLQRLLANAAEEWLAFQRHPDYLLRGSRLDQLEEWHQKTDLALADVEKEYLDASLAERERIRLVEAARQAHERMLESRSRNRLRLIAIMMAIAALIAGLLSFFAMRQRQQALEAYSLSLTANAQTALESGDSATALVLALAAAEVDNPPLLTRQTLLNAAFAPGAHRRYEVETLFPGVHGPATALSISPDGRTLYLGFTEGTIIAWDWEAETEVGRLLAHSARVNEIAVANDNRTILSASEDGFVIQWDLSTRQPLRRLAGHTGAVRTVAISPDGRLAVSGGFANNAYDAPGELFLWDLSSGAILHRFEGHRKGVIQAQFVRSGTAILASSGDLELITDLGGSPESGVLNDTILWDVKTGEQLSRLETLGHDISAIALLPQSEKVLLASYYDAVAVLFDLNTGEVVQSLSGHTDAVLDVTVGMDNKHALTCSKDGTLILWDLNTGQAIAHLHGHSGVVSHVVATPDFRTAFSISRTGD
jgi:serine/threonine protein kinase/DNA-binding SARP family transcriptional activator